MTTPTDATHRNAGGDLFKPSKIRPGAWRQWSDDRWLRSSHVNETLTPIEMPVPSLPMPKSYPAEATHDDMHGRAYKMGKELNWLRYDFVSAEWADVGPLITTAHLIPRNVFTAPAPPPVARVVQPSLAPKWDCVQEPKVPFTNYFLEYSFVGSRVTCNPPPLDTDQDVLVLIHECNRDVMERKMREDGYVREGSNPAELANNVDKQSVFFSYRKGDMNYIVTSSASFYERFRTATELARKYNLMEKSNRIQLFQAVLYGKWWA